MKLFALQHMVHFFVKLFSETIHCFKYWFRHRYKIYLGGLPILCMRSMKPKAYLLSLFDVNGIITLYFVKRIDT